MNRDPILCIIVPSYNTSSYVDECLPTFISDDLIGKIKVILIDDGATDNTKDKIDYYVKNYPDIFEFYHKENGGHGSVINYGVSFCVKAKYFKVIDGDDKVNTDQLIKLVNFLYDCDYDVVISQYELFSDNFNKIINEGFSKSKELSFSDLNSLMVTIHSLTYKVSIFKENKIFLPEKIFYEDNEYRLLPFKFIKGICYVPYCVYKYRVNNVNQSVSVSSMLKHLNDLEYVMDDLHDNIKKMDSKNDSYEYISIGLGSVIRQAFLLYLLKIDNRSLRREKILHLAKIIKENYHISSYMKKTCKAYKLLSYLKFRLIFFVRFLSRNSLN